MENKLLPLIPLRGLTVLPSTSVNFDVGRPKSVLAVEECVQKYGGQILLISQKSSDVANPRREDLRDYGVLARIIQVINHPDESMRVVVDAVKRVELLRIAEFEPCFLAEYSVCKDLKAKTVEVKAYQRKCAELVEEHYYVGERINKEMFKLLTDTQETAAFLYRTAHLFNYKNKQALLDEADIFVKYGMLCDFLAEELAIAKIEKKITKKVKSNIDKGQKEYFLREQIKAIQEELGDEDDDDTMAKIEALPIKDEYKEKLMKDVRRMQKMPVSSPDYSIARNYLDFVLELPWGVESEDNNDVKNARVVLDEDHYGLEKIKEEFWSFWQSASSPIARRSQLFV
jgi:ATP-dependent Lon protease, bacterial type